jgi:hypothetical protein
MVNIGQYPFAEEARQKITKLAELIKEGEQFIEDALKIVSVSTFTTVIKRVDPAVIEELKKSVTTPGLFQSTFRTKVAEQTVSEVFKKHFNEYIDKLLSETGGNYTEEVNKEIESLKFQMSLSSGLSLAAK